MAGGQLSRPRRPSASDKWATIVLIGGLSDQHLQRLRALDDEAWIWGAMIAVSVFAHCTGMILCDNTPLAPRIAYQ